MAVHFSHCLPIPIWGARFSWVSAHLDNDGDPTDLDTPATEVSKDGGTYAATTESPTAISGQPGATLFTLTSTEMEADVVSVAFANDVAPENAKTTVVTLYPQRLPVIGSGTLQAGSSGGFTLDDVGLIPFDISGALIRTTGGTGGASGARQARKIMTHVISTGVCTIAPNWETNPSTDTTYEILLPPWPIVSMVTRWAGLYILESGVWVPVGS